MTATQPGPTAAEQPWSRSAPGWLGALVDLIVPPRCALCTTDLAASCPPMLCGTCKLGLSTGAGELRCLRCAAVLTTGDRLQPRDGCYFCRETKVSFQAAAAFGRYDGLLREALLRMKHSSDDHLSQAIGALCAARLDDQVRRWWADRIVPVPLHWQRRWQRGSNSAEIVGTALARRLNLPLARRSVVRRRPTSPQVGLLPHQRQRNVADAFRVRRPEDVAGQRVIIVDDILTTGATVNELARTLRRAGAGWIGVVAVARTDHAQESPAGLDLGL
ncbi:MAG: ComF family protein [Pirellulales bacterium]|nr:ComF family protein [Pirellulales bacterium]